MNDFVTVVIPVYNVENYISKCLDSIISQTYKNLEIIVVNDGTKDGSLKICEEFAKKDARIRVITQENGGLSAARNTGIKNATGKYICFVDSDDYVDKDYVYQMLKAINKEDADICSCDFWYVDENGNKWERKQKVGKVYSSSEAIVDVLLNTQDTEVMAWNKLYKLSLFKDNNIFFPKGKLHEDNFTTYKLYYYSKKVVLISDRLYYYLQRNNSIMGKKFNEKRLHAVESIYDKIEFFKEKEENFEDEIEFHELAVKLNVLNIMIRDGYEDDKKYELIDSIISKKKEFMKNKYVTIKYKILLLLLSKKAKVYGFALKNYSKVK